mmetsp:Transcript_20456/g.66435  ORF Transcript_20456/g.66435 Transcript_20456/m.66435 type:complete len:200 (-) Transcript_20456:652-1251(-)
MPALHFEGWRVGDHAFGEAHERLLRLADADELVVREQLLDALQRRKLGLHLRHRLRVRLFLLRARPPLNPVVEVPHPKQVIELRRAVEPLLAEMNPGDNLRVVEVARLHLVLVRREVRVDEAKAGVPQIHADRDAPLVRPHPCHPRRLGRGFAPAHSGCHVQPCKHRQPHLPQRCVEHLCVLLLPDRRSEAGYKVIVAR